MFLKRKFQRESFSSDLITDIIENLRSVLSTKRSCGHFLPDFGLTESGYRTSEEMVVTLSAELKESIKRYEPRVRVTDNGNERLGKQKLDLVVK